MTPDEVVQELTACRALLEGHFVLTSGRHSSRFVQFSVVLQHPDIASRLCRALADLWSDCTIDTVVGPAMGGIIIAYETARALGARNLFTEKHDGSMRLLRGFNLAPGERVLVVDDVVTTGGSLKDTVAVVRQAGAAVVGASVLVHRDAGGAIDFGGGCDYRPLATVEAVSYDPDDCPLCRQGVPVTDPDLRKT